MVRTSSWTPDHLKTLSLQKQEKSRSPTQKPEDTSSHTVLREAGHQQTGHKFYKACLTKLSPSDLHVAVPPPRFLHHCFTAGNVIGGEVVKNLWNWSKPTVVVSRTFTGPDTSMTFLMFGLKLGSSEFLHSSKVI